MAMKYLHHKMDHLPVRYAMHRNILDIIFTVVTLNLELKENEVNCQVYIHRYIFFKLIILLNSLTK